MSEEMEVKNNPFQKLVKDLKETKDFCKLSEYPNITLQDLNDYLVENNLSSKYFGNISWCFYEAETDELIPISMVAFGKGLVVAKIAALLGGYLKWKPKQGACVMRNTEGDHKIVMPDVAYIVRHTQQSSGFNQLWKYPNEEPFTPKFVVEIDILAGHGSQLKRLDEKMRNIFSPSGVNLGWLIDPTPENKIMIEYRRKEDGSISVSKDKSWRNLDGGDVLPGFVLYSVDLDMVLNQESGSSEEEDLKEPFVCFCNQTFQRIGKIAEHMELHRAQAQRVKFLQRQNLRNK